MMTPIPTSGLTQSLRKRSLSHTKKNLSSEIHRLKTITETMMECRVLIACADNLLRTRRSRQLRKARHMMTSLRAKEGVGPTVKNRLKTSPLCSNPLSCINRSVDITMRVPLSTMKSPTGATKTCLLAGAAVPIGDGGTANGCSGRMASGMRAKGQRAN